MNRRREGSRANPPPAGEHPSGEDLVACLEGRLSRFRAERVRDHLAACPECATLALEAAEFTSLPPAAGVAPLATEEVEHDWRRLRDRLPPPPERAAAGAARAAWRRRRASLGGRLAALWGRLATPVAALAAALVLVTVGFGGWALSLRQQLQRLTQPRADVVLVDLFPEGEVFRGPEPDVTRTAHRGPLVLVLHVSPALAAGPLALELVREEPPAGERRRVTDVVPGVEGEISLHLPRALPPGRYRVALYGGRGGARRPVETFRFEIGGR
jgi:hypothetical protein